MSVRTSYEDKRGCGFRKGGGTYLVSDGIGIDCDLLPVELSVCPVCHAGIKPSRGWTWVEPDELLPHHVERDGKRHGESHPGCPLNIPGLLGERCGLLWIGEAFYPYPEDWIAEGREMGFSRRIPAVPRKFVVGVTWVLVAHRKAIRHIEALDGYDMESVYAPGIFHVWRPQRIEYVVRGDETDEQLEALEKRGLDLVQVVPLQQEIA